jgi:hypothetical protein
LIVKPGLGWIPRSISGANCPQGRGLENLAAGRFDRHVEGRAAHVGGNDVLVAKLPGQLHRTHFADDARRIEDGKRAVETTLAQHLLDAIEVGHDLRRQIGVERGGRGAFVFADDRSDVARDTDIRELLDADVETFAVAFLWSFRNPEHERIAHCAVTSSSSIGASTRPA